VEHKNINLDKKERKKKICSRHKSHQVSYHSNKVTTFTISKHKNVQSKVVKWTVTGEVMQVRFGTT